MWEAFKEIFSLEFSINIISIKIIYAKTQVTYSIMGGTSDVL